MFAPDSVSVPVPCLTIDPPASEITPEISVLVFRPPTVSALVPSSTRPAPSSEPMLTPAVVRLRMRTTPPALLMTVALSAVAVS